MTSSEGRNLSVGEVQAALKKAVGPNATLIRYTSNFIEPGKIGFMGEHGFILVEYQENQTDQGAQKISFFIKRVPEIKGFRDYIINFGLFAKEKECYEKLFPLMCESLDATRLPLPRCYLISDEKKYILQEDMSRAGYKPKDRFEYLDLAHCEAAFESIAQLHAGSIAIEAKTEKIMPFYMKYSHEIVNIKERRAPVDLAAYWNENSLITTANLLFKMDEFKERLAGVSREKLSEKLQIVWDDLTNLAAGFSAKFTNVLSHGDLWINNMMYKIEENGEVKVILVDFQTYRYAPPVLDLLSLLHINTSRKFRCDHQSELLRIYHVELMAFLHNANVNTDLAPSLEQLEDSAHALRVFGIALAVRYLPNVLRQDVTPEHQHDISDAEKDGMPHEYFRDSSDLILKSFTRSPVMKSRVLEALEELVDYLDL